MRTAPPLLLPIFRSAGQARLLAAAFLGAGAERTVTELAARSGLSYPAAHREVGALVQAGLLADRRVGNVRMISADSRSPFYGPLGELLEVAFGPVPLLRVALASVAGIEAVGIFGSYAGRLGGEPGPPPQDVDVLVVGSPDLDEVYDACAAVARRVGRPVSPTVLSAAEWQAGSAFLTQVRRGPYVPVVGQLPDVAAPVRDGESR
jgi:DNA-binding transcriptional ArsR family regulator